MTDSSSKVHTETGSKNTRPNGFGYVPCGLDLVPLAGRYANPSVGLKLRLLDTDLPESVTWLR